MEGARATSGSKLMSLRHKIIFSSSGQSRYQVVTLLRIHSEARNSHKQPPQTTKRKREEQEEEEEEEEGGKGIIINHIVIYFTTCLLC